MSVERLSSRSDPSTVTVAFKPRSHPLSPKTIEVHRLDIKKKLNLQTAAELIRDAVRWVETQSTGVRTDRPVRLIPPTQPDQSQSAKTRARWQVDLMKLIAIPKHDLLAPAGT